MKSRLLLAVLLTTCASFTPLTTAAQESATAPAVTAASHVVPNLINYTGVLKDATGRTLISLTGVTFLLYKDEQGGAPLWMETQNVQPDKVGRYNVQLGAASKNGIAPDLFMNGEARWLAVQIGNEAEQSRVLLVAVPYAMKSIDAQTLGGLPPSAFVLAAPPASGSAAASATSAASASGSAAVPPPAVAVTTSGAAANVGTIALFSTATDIEKSIVTQTGTTAINVGGGLNVKGTFTLPATGTSTALKGFNSEPERMVASSFSSSLAVPVAQNFQWQAEAVGNNTATPSGTLNLLYATGTAVPAETGLNVNSKGQIHFAPGQGNIPGAGTITGITTAAASGLIGGVTSGNASLSLLKTCSSGQLLKWNGSVWACANDLNSGGTVRSVGLTAPFADFTVTGSPVTGTGTLNLAWNVAPTSANNADAIVKRDGSGNFTANNITASNGNFTINVNAVGGNFAGNVTAAGQVSGQLANFTTATAGSTTGAFANTGGGPILSALTTSNNLLAGVDGSGNGVGAAMLVSAPAAPVQLQGILAFGGDSGTSSAASAALNGGGGNNTNNGNGGPGVIGVGGAGGTSGGFGGAGGAFTGWFGSSGDGDGIDATNHEGGTFANSGAYAGNFTGDINVTGSVFAIGKDFKMDHPLDPANKYLFHASVESSEMMNIYTGNVVLDANGETRIELPGWFEALNHDFRYQLTAIGKPSPGLYIAEKISGNHFSIAGGSPGAEISWQVTAVRHDPYAQAHPLVIEQEKEARLKGYYIHPELYGAPGDKQIEWARNPEWMRSVKELRAKAQPAARAGHQNPSSAASAATQK